MRMRLYGCLYLSYIHTYIRTYVRTSVYLCRNIFTQTYSIQPTSRTQRPSLTQANHHRHECSPCLRPWSKFMKRAVAPISAAVLRSGWLRVQDEQMLISPPSGSEGGYVLRANIYIYIETNRKIFVYVYTIRISVGSETSSCFAEFGLGVTLCTTLSCRTHVAIKPPDCRTSTAHCAAV